MMNTEEGNAGSDQDFLLLKRRIFNDTSIDCSQYKDNYLKRRIKVRMRAGSLRNYREYLNLLTTNPMEYEYLLRDLTINVTQFFRDPEVFTLLEEEILPLLIFNKVKEGRRVIRIWSAGCASGEESYSVAILLHYLLGEEFDNFLVTVHATDIDEKSLRAARSGTYLPRQVENVKPSYLERYLEFDGEMYRISEEIREMVKFKNQDLFALKKGGHYDLILCRNVLIYFTREMQDRLISQFYRSLNYGGYLIIGKTETIMGAIRERFKIVNTKERVYQKTKK